MQVQLDAMTGILKQLKSDKEQAAEQQSVLALKQLMTSNIDKIKVTFKQIGYSYGGFVETHIWIFLHFV